MKLVILRLVFRLYTIWIKFDSCCTSDGKSTITDTKKMSNYVPDLVLRKNTTKKTTVVRPPGDQNVRQYQSKIERYADGDEKVEVKTQFSSEFVNKLKSQRNELKLTQDKYATLLGVKHAIIRDLEAGTLRYDPQLVQKLSNAYDRAKRSQIIRKTQ